MIKMPENVNNMVVMSQDDPLNQWSKPIKMQLQKVNSRVSITQLDSKQRKEELVHQEQAKQAKQKKIMVTTLPDGV